MTGDTTRQVDAGRFDELLAATIRTAVDEWRVHNDPADPHGVGMPEYIRQALADAGLLAGAVEVQRLTQELSAWRSGARRRTWPTVATVPDGVTYAAHLARAQGTEGGEEHDRLLREASQRMKALRDAAQTLLQERDVLTWLHAEARWHAEHHRAQVETQGLSHALLLKGVPDLLKQVDAQGQRIREQEAELAEFRAEAEARAEAFDDYPHGDCTDPPALCCSDAGCPEHGDRDDAEGEIDEEPVNLPADVVQEADISPRPRVWPTGSPAPDECVTKVIAANDVTFTRTNRGLWRAEPPEGNGREYAWAWISDVTELTEVLEDGCG
jgi:hypothetical protein